MADILKKIFGDDNEKAVKQLSQEADRVLALEGTYREGLPGATSSFKQRLGRGESLDDVLPDAFAAVREAATRTLEQTHFPVQVIGGVALHKGMVAEMKTGEGKTLTATLAAYLNALEGKGVHVVTVNEYLARRDAVWMGQIYHALGMTVSCLTHEGSFLYDPSRVMEAEKADEERDEVGGFKVLEDYLRPVLRKEAYEADITYGTNNEFGFDYLRDNMAHSFAQRVQRGHRYAIVDEVDSVLIDEARTPLIISAPDQESSTWYRDFARLIPRLNGGEDYEVDEKQKAVTLTERGIDRVEQLLGGGDIYQEKGIKYLHHLEQALRAQALFERDRDYVVRDNQVVIVDEFTGRLLPGRRFSGGLHQALEAKEGVAVQAESITLASITFQNYFRLYDKLAGMTGTAATSAEEFHQVYGLPTVVIPPNKPVVREDRADRVYRTEQGKLQAVVREVKERHEKGQPVLVGTVSIEKNERLSQMLSGEGVEHRLLNAKNHEQEGEVIAQAGRRGAVTVATNMAGRGVDIVLGGNPPENAEEVKELGGLHVLGTERHEARRIDNQLRGRSGRQGDPGSSVFFVSLQDDLMRIFGGERIAKVMSGMKIPEDEAIESKMVSNALESAQSKVEGLHFDARKHLLEFDDVLNRHREAVYKRRMEILEKAEQGTLKPHLVQLAQKAGFTAEEYEKKEEELGEENMRQAERVASLRAVDSLWMEHLENMEQLRDSVRLRAYGQQDPLLEYKNEGRRMFEGLLNEIDSVIANSLMRAQLNAQQPQQPPIAPAALSPAAKKTGRNDPCPCGSGKKYKKCHGK